MKTGKRYIQKHVQERRNPKRLPNVDDLKALWQRIDAQAARAEGQIALIADDSERTALSVIWIALRAKQDELANVIDARLARAEQEKGPVAGSFQRIGDVLEKMNRE